MSHRRAKRRRLLIIISSAVAMFIIFSQTSTYRLLGLYAFMGMYAPIKVRTDCIKTSVFRVKQKFTLPLQFDAHSKNALRQYWHYSYYHECLQNHGYDVTGRPLSPSSITPEANKFNYHNPQAGFSLIGIDSAEMKSDNQINSDYDTRLLLSNLVINGQPLTVAAYQTHDQIDDLASAQQYMKYFPTTEGKIIASTMSAALTGVPYLFLEQDDNHQGIVVMSANHPIIFFGENFTPLEGDYISQHLQL